jgi:hypothetical protein
MDYPARTYHFTLQHVGWTVGLLLLVVHLFALLRPGKTQEWLKKLPRSKMLGITILIVDAVWSLWLASTMDLGEFSRYRRIMQIVVPVIAVLTILYVDDFLAARALGILALLAAAPMISSAFLQPELSRLVLVLLAYVWLTLGMFWVGKPYLLRDQINWLTGVSTRYRLAAIGGVIYGALILVLAFTW